VNPRVLIIPAAFLLLIVLLAVGLKLNPREVPSPLIGKPAPSFELPLLGAPEKTFSQREMLGKVWILNVWASWCAPCLAEHPVITELARSGLAPVVGLNYKDATDDALPWLQRNGDPFVLTAQDADGRIGIDYGVYGVPETYVIDRDGVIRYKRIGPLTPEAVQKDVVPLLKELNGRG
jgi:cytochrome c biogenesis protein CcmG, thiol:disulfide interchange protein DsbE